MKRSQVERWYRKLYESVTRGSGYQPYGWDWLTMNAIAPGFRVAYLRLRELWLNAEE